MSTSATGRPDPPAQPGPAQLLEQAPLGALREWAWERGRTDVVGRLDTYAAALAFLGAPSLLGLVRLGELLPVRPRSGWVESAVQELLLARAEASLLHAFARNLVPWLALLGWQLVADLDEMGSN